VRKKREALYDLIVESSEFHAFKASAKEIDEEEIKGIVSTFKTTLYYPKKT